MGLPIVDGSIVVLGANGATSLMTDGLVATGSTATGSTRMASSMGGNATLTRASRVANSSEGSSSNSPSSKKRDPIFDDAQRLGYNTRASLAHGPLRRPRG